MLSYRPGTTLAHRLDPRVKLAFQTAFVAVTALTRDPFWIGVLTILAGLAVGISGLTIQDTLWAFRVPVLLVAVGPLVAGVTVGPPWFETTPAARSAQSGYLIILTLLLTGAYLRSTPVREMRAAVQWLLPGRLGRLLGVGLGLVARMLPLIRKDLRRIRAAQTARLGETQPWSKQAAQVGITGLKRTFDRADRLADGLQARCFAWNPTLPTLTIRKQDYVVLGVSGLLLIGVLLCPTPTTNSGLESLRFCESRYAFSVWI